MKYQVYRQPAAHAYYDYVNFSAKNPECIHVVLSQRAYNTILAETFSYNGMETGGVLIGHIYRRIWYVTDVIPPGIQTRHTVVNFHLDLDFVNFLAGKIGDVYRYKPTILGLWHRHPGSMDTFSQEDFDTIYSNERDSRFGILSMLVNIDPELRMTFYHAHHGRLMSVRYDQGDAYFPEGMLDLATPQQLLDRRKVLEGGRGLRIKENHTVDPEKLPRTIEIRHPEPGSPDPAAGQGINRSPDPAVGQGFNRPAEPAREPGFTQPAAGYAGKHVAQAGVEPRPEAPGPAAQNPAAQPAAEEARRQEEARRREEAQDLALQKLDQPEWPNLRDQVSAFLSEYIAERGSHGAKPPIILISAMNAQRRRNLAERLIDVLDAFDIADKKSAEWFDDDDMGGANARIWRTQPMSQRIPNGVAVICAPEIQKRNPGRGTIREVVQNCAGVVRVVLCDRQDFESLNQGMRPYTRHILSYRL